MLHARKDYQARIQDSARLIPKDEPVFLIRAQDIVGPATVRQWATFAELQGVDPAMINAARAHAEAMISWQRRHGGGKVPDMPTNMSGYDLPRS